MYGREARDRWHEVPAPVKADRQVIWTLDSPDRYGSISGVIVLSEDEL